MTRDEWLEDRRKSIGGSDAAAVIGLNRYRTPMEVYADKLGALPPKEEPPLRTAVQSKISSYLFLR